MTDRIKRETPGPGAWPDDPLPLRAESYSAEDIADFERQQRMTGWLLLFFGGATLATAVLAFTMFSDDLLPTDESERPDRTQSQQPQEGSAAPFVWGTRVPDAEEAAQSSVDGGQRPILSVPSEDAIAATIAEPEPQLFEFPGPPETSAVPTFGGPPPGSVDRETARALRSGKAQLWREDGQRGYVLVSGTTTYGARECRQVSYTRFERERQALSPATQWCRTGKSSKWRPDPRGAD